MSNLGNLGSATQGNRAARTQASALPVKTLAALTLAVLLAHAFLLQGASLSLRASENKVTRPFTTRVIEIKPASPPGSEPPAVPAVPTPAKLPDKVAVRQPKKPATRPIAAPTPAEANSTDSSQNYGQNQAVALVPYAGAAINSEANEPITSAAVVGPAPVPVLPDSPASAASSAQTAGLAAAQAPVPPASQASAAASPSGPNAPTTAYTVPGSVRLKYNVTGGKGKLSYTARAELLWLQDGSTYEARLEVGAFLIGSRQFTSTGRMTADGLAPLRYADKTRTEVAAHFDRERQRVTFSANTPEAPLQSGAQDRVSVFVQLGSMIAGEPAKYPAGTSISLQIIGPRATEIWVVTVDGEETLNLPGGELAALKLTRGFSRDFDVKTEFWLAPTLGYLPARIRFTQANGDYVDQAWRATEAP